MGKYILESLVILSFALGWLAGNFFNNVPKCPMCVSPPALLSQTLIPPQTQIPPLTQSDCPALQNVPQDRKGSTMNPEMRDNWIHDMAVKLCAKGPTGVAKKVLDVSAGAKPYERVWTEAGCAYESNEFAGNSNIVDNFRGENGGKKNLDRLHTYVGTDISNTNAPSATFDIVVLTEVLEHLPEPAKAIPELARVAKPGASILITSPFTSGSHQQPYHFSSGYSREWYQYVAKQNGLEVQSIETQGDYFKLMAQETERVLTCKPALPNTNVAFLKQLRETLYYYLLELSNVHGKSGGCADQFTIGWMAHLKKPT